MPFTQFSSSELTADHIGRIVRISWRPGSERDDSSIQGHLMGILHTQGATTVTVRVGRQNVDLNLRSGGGTLELLNE